MVMSSELLGDVIVLGVANKMGLFGPPPRRPSRRRTVKSVVPRKRTYRRRSNNGSPF